MIPDAANGVLLRLPQGAPSTGLQIANLQSIAVIVAGEAYIAWGLERVEVMISIRGRLGCKVGPEAIPMRRFGATGV